jgi:hypothetical protein
VRLAELKGKANAAEQRLKQCLNAVAETTSDPSVSTVKVATTLKHPEIIAEAMAFYRKRLDFLKLDSQSVLPALTRRVDIQDSDASNDQSAIVNELEQLDSFLTTVDVTDTLNASDILGSQLSLGMPSVDHQTINEWISAVRETLAAYEDLNQQSCDAITYAAHLHIHASGAWKMYQAGLSQQDASAWNKLIDSIRHDQNAIQSDIKETQEARCSLERRIAWLKRRLELEISWILYGRPVVIPIHHK